MNGQTLVTWLSSINKRRTLAVSVSAVVFCIAQPSLAVTQRAPEVQVIDANAHTVQNHWMAFDDGYVGGLTVAVGDVDGDGAREVVVAQSGGADAHGELKIFSSAGVEKAAYPLYAQDIEGSEISLAVGNVDADASDEIVVGLFTGTRSMVYIYDGRMRFDLNTVGAFEAFPGEQTGVTVAIANVTGDAASEIIVGSGEKVKPRVRMFTSQGKTIGKDIVPFAETDQHGVTVAGLHHATGYDDIAVGQAAGTTAVKQYRIDRAQTYPVVNQTAGWSREFMSGLSLAGIDWDADGIDEVALAPAGDQLGEIRILNHEGKSQLQSALVVFEDDFRGGVALATGQLDTDTQAEYVIVPRIQKPRGDTTRTGKRIEVNLTTQVAYLWEDGYMRNVYLISSGLPSTPSPEGEFSISKKIERHVYDGRPAYFFPNTPWNLRYKEGGPEKNYYFHTAYWHNNFGQPMSHGCINMREADAKFLYFWADIGTPAWLHT